VAAKHVRAVEKQSTAVRPRVRLVSTHAAQHNECGGGVQRCVLGAGRSQTARSVGFAV